jgi:pimeloyl-ACP methyl ester carboxylesterase
MVEHLRSAFRCYAFDERGHGRSSAPPGGDFAWTRFATDGLTVAESFGLDRPAAFGHSAGGTLLLLADLARPRCWSEVYLYEPVVPPPELFGTDESSPAGPPRNPLAEPARRRRREFPNRDAAYANFAGKPPLNVLAPEALRAYVDEGFAETDRDSIVLRCAPESEAATYEQALLHRAWDHLGQVRCPVTIAAGTRSDSLPVAVMQAVAERIGQSRYVTFPTLGHLGPMEDPALVATSILKLVGAHR